LGNDGLKTLFIVEHILSERGLYHVQERPHAEKGTITSYRLDGLPSELKRYSNLNDFLGGMSFTFYTKPTGDFRDLVYICKLTREIPRWSILKKPCDASAGMAYGYKGKISYLVFFLRSLDVIGVSRLIDLPFSLKALIFFDPTLSHELSLRIVLTCG
jgi:hypothetical protein